MNSTVLLSVNETFFTVQGEARSTGTPAVFVRVQGCNVGCEFHDTRHTWSLDAAYQVSPDQMLEKTRDDKTHARMSPGQIAQVIPDYWSNAPHVALTGGEPADYDVQPLCALLEGDDGSFRLRPAGPQWFG